MTEVSVNNINGPMYDYDSVVAGLAPIFNSAFDGGGIEKNLYFSQNVPFRMANVQLITNPHYGDYNRWQWDNGNRQYIQGPGITLTHINCGDIEPIFTVPTCLEYKKTPDCRPSCQVQRDSRPPCPHCKRAGLSKHVLCVR